MKDFSEEELVQALNADKLYDQSISFRRASDILLNKIDTRKEHNMLHVVFVELMFAVELMIKTILVLEKNRHYKTHNISKLLNELGSEYKNVIEVSLIKMGLTESECKVLFNLEDSYTLQRYNEGCILSSEVSLSALHEILNVKCKELLELNDAYQDYRKYIEANG